MVALKSLVKHEYLPLEGASNSLSSPEESIISNLLFFLTSLLHNSRILERFFREHKARLMNFN